MKLKEKDLTRGRAINYCPPVAEVLSVEAGGPLAQSNTEDIINDPIKYGWN